MGSGFIFIKLVYVVMQGLRGTSNLAAIRRLCLGWTVRALPVFSFCCTTKSRKPEGPRSVHMAVRWRWCSAGRWRKAERTEQISGWMPGVVLVGGSTRAISNEQVSNENPSVTVCGVYEPEGRDVASSCDWRLSRSTACLRLWLSVDPDRETLLIPRAASLRSQAGNCLTAL